MSFQFGANVASQSSDSSNWECPACTFLNVSRHLACDVCGTPRQRDDVADIRRLAEEQPQPQPPVVLSVPQYTQRRQFAPDDFGSAAAAGSGAPSLAVSAMNVSQPIQQRIQQLTQPALQQQMERLQLQQQQVQRLTRVGQQQQQQQQPYAQIQPQPPQQYITTTGRLWQELSGSPPSPFPHIPLASAASASASLASSSSQSSYSSSSSSSSIAPVAPLLTSADLVNASRCSDVNALRVEPAAPSPAAVSVQHAPTLWQANLASSSQPHAQAPSQSTFTFGTSNPLSAVPVAPPPPSAFGAVPVSTFGGLPVRPSSHSSSSSSSAFLEPPSLAGWNVFQSQPVTLPATAPSPVPLPSPPLSAPPANNSPTPFLSRQTMLNSLAPPLQPQLSMPNPLLHGFPHVQSQSHTHSQSQTHQGKRERDGHVITASRMKSEAEFNELALSELSREDLVTESLRRLDIELRSVSSLPNLHSFLSSFTKLQHVLSCICLAVDSLKTSFATFSANVSTVENLSAGLSRKRKQLPSDLEGLDRLLQSNLALMATIQEQARTASGSGQSNPNNFYQLRNQLKRLCRGMRQSVNAYQKVLYEWNQLSSSFPSALALSAEEAAELQDVDGHRTDGQSHTNSNVSTNSDDTTTDFEYVQRAAELEEEKKDWLLLRSALEKENERLKACLKHSVKKEKISRAQLHEKNAQLAQMALMVLHTAGLEKDSDMEVIFEEWKRYAHNEKESSDKDVEKTTQEMEKELQQLTDKVAELSTQKVSSSNTETEKQKEKDPADQVQHASENAGGSVSQRQDADDDNEKNSKQTEAEKSKQEQLDGSDANTTGTASTPADQGIPATSISTPSSVAAPVGAALSSSSSLSASRSLLNLSTLLDHAKKHHKDFHASTSAQLNDLLDKEITSRECVVCQCANREVLFEPCGHLILCGGCVDRMQAEQKFKNNNAATPNSNSTAYPQQQYLQHSNRFGATFTGFGTGGGPVPLPAFGMSAHGSGSGYGSASGSGFGSSYGSGFGYGYSYGYGSGYGGFGGAVAQKELFPCPICTKPVFKYHKAFLI